MYSRSCGDGFKLLLPNPDALTCYGAALQVFPCNDGPCPVHCSWGHWTPWSTCQLRQGRSRVRRDGDGGGHGHHSPHGHNHPPQGHDHPQVSNQFISLIGHSNVQHSNQNLPPPQPSFGALPLHGHSAAASGGYSAPLPSTGGYGAPPVPEYGAPPPLPVYGADAGFPVCTQDRTRYKQRPAVNGGDECWGEAAEERFCQSQLCQGG